MEDIRFTLCVAKLISRDVRDKKDAAKMVSAIETQLRFDDSAWDNLLMVLKNNEQTAVMAEKLSNELKKEIASLSSSQAGQ